MGNNYLWGVNGIKDSVEQLENKVNTNTNDITIIRGYVDGLMDRTYLYGENATPYTFNGKKVYVYKFDPNQTLTLPPSDYLTINHYVLEEVLSVNLMGRINNWEGGVEWFQFPMVKRGGGAQVLFALSPQGYPIIKNYTVTGNINIKGYIVYTRN